MKLVIKISCLLFLLIQSSTLFTQTNQHPVIWVTEEERPRILNLIQEHQWARNIVVQLHERVDSLKAVHMTVPSSLLGTVPEFGTEAARHNALLTLAAESGMLYYLTREKVYARMERRPTNTPNWISPLPVDLALRGWRSLTENDKSTSTLAMEKAFASMETA